MYEFETPGALKLQVSNEAGEVRVETGAAGRTEVELRAISAASQAQVEATHVDCRGEGEGQRVIVDVPSPRRGFLFGSYGVDVLVRVPEGTAIEVTTSSADVRAEGRYATGLIRTVSGDVEAGSFSGNLAVTTASGDVHVAEALASLQVRTASGDIDVEQAKGDLSLDAQSGDISVRSAEGDARLQGSSSEVEVRTAAGRLEVKTSSGDVMVHELLAGGSVATHSGDVELLSVLKGKVTVETMSGDVEVGIAPGSQVAVDTESRSGDVRSDIVLSDTAESAGGDGPKVMLEVRTMSGDISLRRGRTIATSV